ncbi:DUF6193 family natural product biosynthesis protein [Kribbella sp. NBC_01505]|uniref:DUF6193 family natural product biosynthesis protein n=1 Tax=Kribbella sp. NBC_01505 TaxID=2903580 RepID=UPI003866A33F
MSFQSFEGAAELYPDLVAAGSLVAALEQTAGGLGVELGEVRGPSSDTATVSGGAAGRGSYSVCLCAVERWVIVDGWSRGVCLIGGKTKDLQAVTQAAAAWRAGATLRELRDRCPFVSFSELSEAHERGPADAVAVEWRLLRRRMQEGFSFPGARELVEAAYVEPKLRQLFPFTSHWSLHFTTCTGYPYTRVIPFVDPLRDGTYQVYDAKLGTVIGRADTAEQAIALVLRHLPPDLGPAVAGTAEDLAGS